MKKNAAVHMELIYNGGRGMVALDLLQHMAWACQEVIIQLGIFGQYVVKFEIGIVQLGPDKSWGPRITVTYTDPAGVECSHTTDFRFIGRGTANPSVKDIVAHLTAPDVLPRMISEHLAKASAVANRVLREIDGVMTKKQT